MKQAIIGMGLITILVLISCIMISLGIDATEQEHLEQAISLATYQSLSECIENGSDVNQCFQEHISELLGEEQYVIDELVGDTERGILSATVTVTYENWGYERQVTCRRSVIYERDEV